MSRPISDLSTDVRIVCAGCPDMLANYVLSQSLSEFLDRTDVWKEWSTTNNTYAATNVAAGYTAWPNHLGDWSRIDLRIKRLDSLRWVDDGLEIPFKTTAQLQEIDPLWDTRTGTRPCFYTHAGEQAAVTGGSPTVSGFRARLYPYAATNTTAGSVIARFVMVTNTFAGEGFDVSGATLTEIPDRIFYAFRDAIAAGAIARLLMMPGKDWTAPRLAASYEGKFERTIASAKSRSDVDLGHGPLVVRYGGI